MTLVTGGNVEMCIVVLDLCLIQFFLCLHSRTGISKVMKLMIPWMR